MNKEKKYIEAEICFGKDFSALLVVEKQDGTQVLRLPMHSFTKNFLENVRKMFFSSRLNSTTIGTRQITSSNGAVPPINAQYRYMFYSGFNTNGTALQTSSYHGIILGTGSPVRSADMIALGAPLDNSFLYYVNPPGYQVFTTYNDTDGGTITISKAYQNITEDTINITLIGFSHYYSTTDYVLFSHDTYSPAITLDPNLIKKFSIILNIIPTMPIAFYNWMKIWFTGTGFDFKNTDGKINSTHHSVINNYGYTSLVRFGSYEDSVDWLAINSSTNLGLFLGSNSASASYNDYRVSKISERTAVTPIPSVVQDGAQTYLDFTNTFWNTSSTASLSINEIGLYVGYYDTIWMPFRYVLTSSVTLEPLQQVEVHFKLKTVFS